MFQSTLPFILSQSARFLAIVFDFLSLQYKERKKLFFLLIISASLISLHYFFLGLITAGVLVMISVTRFIVCYFTTDKRLMILFLIIPTISLYFTYAHLYDFIIYVGLLVFIVGNFDLLFNFKL